MKFTFHNPVDVKFGTDALKHLKEVKGSILLVTSKGGRKRGWIDKVTSLIHSKDIFIIEDAEENPSFKYIESKWESVRLKNPDFIIAVGGGSVIDTAKAFSVFPEKGDFSSLKSLILKKSPLPQYKIIPLIAIPTTSGTGSEVTPWATIWDKKNKKKYSLHLKDLWPYMALVDPSLTLSLPPSLTKSSALDALSHAFEALWNKNRNPISTTLSIKASRIILENLPPTLKNPENIKNRSNLMLASLMAGLSFSNTKTAIAHGISYYLTSHKGIPHGIACSFSLPTILDAVLGKDKDLDSAFYEILGENPTKKLKNFYDKIEVSYKFSNYGTQEDLNNIKQRLFDTPRAGNFLFNPIDIIDHLNHT